MDLELPYSDYVFKVVMVGNKSVGKSCVARKYTCNRFEDSVFSTIGAEYFTKVLKIEGKDIKVHIWDTAGQEQFRTIVPLFYRQAHGIIFVYDCTNAQSFYDLPYWLESSKRYVDTETNKLMLGNKCDLKQQCVIDGRIARAFAESVNVPFFETSAKDGTNIEAAFTAILTAVKRRTDSALEMQDKPESAIELDEIGESVKLLCC